VYMSRLLTTRLTGSLLLVSEWQVPHPDELSLEAPGTVHENFNEHGMVSEMGYS